MSTPGDLLVVDDDDDMLEVMEMLLRTAGFRVRTAVNGRDALAAVAAAMPALILLDMRMPIMDGHEFVQVFRARYGHRAPIVVLTAAEHAKSHCQVIDVADVLTKPFDLAELLRVVSRYAVPNDERSR